MKEEKDIRGFIPVQGWAHGIAHGADAIEELPHFEYMTKDDLHQLLELARDTMTTNLAPYICREDKRMAAPIITLLKKNILTKEEIYSWLESFNKIEADLKLPEDRYAIHNLTLFLKTLYFKVLQEESLDDSIAEKIKEVLFKTR